MGEIFWFYGLIFVFGLFLGSFLNVVIDRLPKGQSILYPPSHCPHCRHRLAFYDLVPLFSFFYLKGRCRYCKEKISLYYPVVEVSTGILFALTAYMVKVLPIVYLIYLLLVISALMVVFFVDLKYGIIPFKVVGITLVIVTLWYLLNTSVNISDILRDSSDCGLRMTNAKFAEEISCAGPILNYFFSGIGVFAAFLLLFLATKGRGIGFGDVVFSFLMGYVLGFPKIVLGVYIAFLTGAIISLILIMARKKRFRGGVIPFGPFLVTGTVISLFWGQVIVDMFVSYFYV